MAQRQCGTYLRVHLDCVVYRVQRVAREPMKP
jgi:hypothetical protein